MAPRAAASAPATSSSAARDRRQLPEHLDRQGAARRSPFRIRHLRHAHVRWGRRRPEQLRGDVFVFTKAPIHGSPEYAADLAGWPAANCGRRRRSGIPRASRRLRRQSPSARIPRRSLSPPRTFVTARLLCGRGADQRGTARACCRPNPAAQFRGSARLTRRSHSSRANVPTGRSRRALRREAVGEFRAVVRK